MMAFTDAVFYIPMYQYYSMQIVKEIGYVYHGQFVFCQLNVNFD